MCFYSEKIDSLKLKASEKRESYIESSNIFGRVFVFVFKFGCWKFGFSMDLLASI